MTEQHSNLQTPTAPSYATYLLDRAEAAESRLRELQAMMAAKNNDLFSYELPDALGNKLLSEVGFRRLVVKALLQIWEELQARRTP